MTLYANKHNIPAPQRPAWVRRQLGGCIEIINKSGYISKPCLQCKYELSRYNLKVTYKDENLDVVTKFAKDIKDSKLTSYQKKVITAYKKNK